MASVVAVGIFNVVAFTGYLFNKLNHSNYEKEIKSHNEVMEKLSKAKEKWYEEQVNNKEKIEMLRQRASDVNADINQTNKALEELRKITREPKLEDYYQPSNEMKEYQLVVVSLTGFTGGFLFHKIIN